MRLFTGFTAVLIFILIFAAMYQQLSREVIQAEPIDRVLSERIEFDDVLLAANSRILDRSGTVVSDVYSAENRIFLPYAEIPGIVKDMFLAVEDRKFYAHQGFDANGIARALMVNLQAGDIDEGGSTITQQVARNLYLSHEQTYERKLSELLHAYQMEQEMTKEEIFELYLNSIYFANGVYGIEAAASFYFDKTTSELSLGELSYIGGIPNSPSRYNPLEHPEALKERQQTMLQRMLAEGHISEEEAAAAEAESIELNLRERTDNAPDYVTYVYHELEELIAEEEGFNRRLESAEEAERSVIREALADRIEQVLQSGVTIETAMHPQQQDHVVQQINSRLGNTGVQAAAAVVDHSAAEITAITGGVGYDKFDFHRGFQSFRQPGSALKPLLSFGPYLEEQPNIHAGSVINAGPFSYNGYTPRNFGGGVYGHVTVQEALKNSYNTAAVRMLHDIGISTGFSYLNRLEFSRIQEGDEHLPAALGGLSEGVSVRELTQAYSIFAADGVYRFPRAIRGVFDQHGELLYEWEDRSRRIFETETNQSLRAMLRRVVEDGTGTEAFYAHEGYLGGKTGTTNDYHDLWFVGSSSTYTTGLWMGRDQRESIVSMSEANAHTGLWRSIMEQLPQ
ncbi:transglycosylase domain-containing protein [Alkalicoccus chagannorensis]|uniref:transglycosylase domain-containing protein n=1 Tax=Alkalicoccus chagannorensis TaxID=427072 RepID=UPI0003F68F28|nr:transglycosylase domain-containing protein [Alkalicoccus chagannorensis]